jgi:hypothetical protein
MQPASKAAAEVSTASLRAQLAALEEEGQRATVAAASSETHEQLVALFDDAMARGDAAAVRTLVARGLRADKRAPGRPVLGLAIPMTSDPRLNLFFFMNETPAIGDIVAALLEAQPPLQLACWTEKTSGYNVWVRTAYEDMMHDAKQNPNRAQASMLLKKYFAKHYPDDVKFVDTTGSGIKSGKYDLGERTTLLLDQDGTFAYEANYESYDIDRGWWDYATQTRAKGTWSSDAAKLQLVGTVTETTSYPDNKPEEVKTGEFNKVFSLDEVAAKWKPM